MAYLANGKPLTLTDFARMKAQGEKIAVLTCYDASFAALEPIRRHHQTGK